MSREMKSTELEWLGDIPNDWETIPNKHLMKKKKELCPKFNGEDILSLSMKGVYVRDPNDESGKRPATYDGYQYVNDGDLLMCLFDIDVTPRCVGRVYDNGLTSPAYSRMIMNPKRANVDYYYYYYLALDFDKTLLHLSKNMRSSLTEADFGGIKAPVPPITEQRQIVSFLDRKCSAIDTAIEKTKKSIEKLEEYKKAVITKAVTKGLDPNAKMKDSGVEWIGDIPEDWDILRGKFIFKKLSRPVKETDDVITCFRDGEVTLRKNRRKEGFTFSDKEIGYQGIEPGDLVVHGMDGFAGSIGISDSRGKATPVLNVLDSARNKKYYMYYLRSMAYGDVFNAIATGIRVRSCNLNWNKLAELNYPVPSKETQQAIVDYIDDKLAKTDALIAKKQEAISKWEEYKKSLIYYAVTGKIDCRNEAI